MSDSEPFLSRWSRRKRESEDAAAPERSTPPVAGAAGAEQTQPAESIRTATSTGADAPGCPPATTGPSQDQDLEGLLTKLPNIEDLTSQNDLVAFMQRGVPDALRNAALRKMWSVDPAIRDFVGFYADYAWDWNTPGGAPGCGPLTESDDVQVTLRQLFGHPSTETVDASVAREDEPVREVPRDQTPQAADLDAEGNHAATQQQAGGAGDTEVPDAEPAQDLAVMSEEFRAEDKGPADFEAGPDSELLLTRRRHGGAIPA